MTIRCTRSVLTAAEAARDMAEVAVTIVDNASGDGSVERLRAWIDSLGPDRRPDLVASDVNGGFSAGHNLGIFSARADYYLLLNSDALLHPDFFMRIVPVAEAHPEAGFIAPTLEHEDGTQQVSGFRFHSPVSELVRAAGSGPVTRAFRRSVVAIDPPYGGSDLEWASFACILVNRAVIDDIGSMDEGYFLYFEDCEYCRRARRAGWRVVAAPQARAVHLRGGSGPLKEIARRRGRMPRYHYVSRSRYFAQSYGHAGLLWANLLWHTGRAVAHLRPLLGQRVPAAYEREARDLWIGFLRPLATRGDTP